MISSLFILNKDATILIEKQYREHINRSQIDSACLQIKEKSTNISNVLSSGDFTTILHQQEEIWLVGVCEGDEFVLFGVSLLKHIGYLLSSLLKNGVTEVSIKEEYDQVYQILDLAVDFGYPYLDESNTIQTVINRPPIDPKARGANRLALDLQKPWRQMNIKRFTNEILVDIIETVDLVVSPHGRNEFCHIKGEIKINSKLSETPTCKLILLPSTHYEDVVFHRCAEVENSDSKVIPFIPPDGPFTLLQYRLTATQTNLPIWIIPKFTWSKGSVSFEITIRPDQNLVKPLEDVEIRFELPHGVSSPSLAAPEGKALFDISTRDVVWTFTNYSKKDSLILKGSASTESTFDLGGRNPIVCAKFLTVGFVPSGFKIDRLEIEGVDYRIFKGVKYIAKSGNYEFRTGL